MLAAMRLAFLFLSGDQQCWSGGVTRHGDTQAQADEGRVEGLSRAVSGVFAEDSNGGVWVLHRGKIRGGKALFFQYYQGETLTADDGGKPDTFALIGSLNDTAFPAKLAAFVHQILAIKAAAKHAAI